MLGSVEFYNKTSLVTVKIGDKSIYNSLLIDLYRISLQKIVP